MNKLLLVFTGAFLVACQSADDAAPAQAAAEPAAAVEEAPAAEEDRLSALLDAQPDDIKARYQYRHPQETLEFFGIEPGMTIVEGLPGRGWYTKVLLPYLGSEGHLIGANYPLDLWPNFPFATEEFMAEMSQWLEKWPADAEEWRGEDGASVGAFWFGEMPEEVTGTADAVFFVRLLHNVGRHGSLLFGCETGRSASMIDACRRCGWYGGRVSQPMQCCQMKKESRDPTVRVRTNLLSLHVLLDARERESSTEEDSEHNDGESYFE